MKDDSPFRYTLAGCKLTLVSKPEQHKYEYLKEVSGIEWNDVRKNVHLTSERSFGPSTASVM